MPDVYHRAAILLQRQRESEVNICLEITMSESPIAKTVEMWTELIHNLAGPATKEFGLLFGEKARAYRLRNLIAVTNEAKRKLQNAGLEEKAVPPRLLLPIIENCSVEDDESLQSMWAGLLATASREGNAVSPAFIETLKQLTPDEARAFDRLYQASLDEFKKPRAFSAGEPERPMKVIVLDPEEAFARTLIYAGELPVKMSDFRYAVHASLVSTFERLGLMRREFFGTPPKNFGYLDPIDDVTFELRFTLYACLFIGACRGPVAS